MRWRSLSKRKSSLYLAAARTNTLWPLSGIMANEYSRPISGAATTMIKALIANLYVIVGQFEMRLLITAAALSLFALEVFAGWFESGGTGWKEEVKLHDGQVIVVERFYHLGGYPAIESHNRSPLDETLTFRLPGSDKEIVWKTEFNNGPELNSLGPMLLDVVEGIPYLATSPAGCIAYNKWGRPNPPYVLFKYENGAWQRIPLEAFPAALVHSNLMSRPDSRILKPYYNVEQASEHMQGRNIASEARSILRETIPDFWKSCPVMVSYGKKGGWIGLDWFNDQPSLDACLSFCNQKGVSPETCPCNSIFKGRGNSLQI